MVESKKDFIAMGSKIGAVLGFIVFLLFGLIPGFYFGSYATLIILSRLFGGPLQSTLLVKVLVTIGIILGIACIAAASIVIGAIFGTVVGYLTAIITGTKEESHGK